MDTATTRGDLNRCQRPAPLPRLRRQSFRNARRLGQTASSPTIGWAYGQSQRHLTKRRRRVGSPAVATAASHGCTLRCSIARVSSTTRISSRFTSRAMLFLLMAIHANVLMPAIQMNAPKKIVA